MGLSITPNYGFSLNRKATDEEILFVLKLLTEQEYDLEPSIKLISDQSSLMFLHSSNDTEQLHAGAFLNVEGLFEFSVKEKQKLNIEFKEFMNHPDLPESLRDLSQWDEKICMEVST